MVDVGYSPLKVAWRIWGQVKETAMNACSYVGRVGGLALALGVGAAVFGGTAAAWADDDGSAPPATSARSEQSTTTAGPTSRRTVSAGSPIRTARSSATAVKPAATTPTTGGVQVADRVRAVAAVSYTHLTLPTTPYV